ncbi:MAG: alginate lyase family protein [Desulfobacterales bacterium]|nr:alginate lyase family protein [Desulfobacterales bacterium]
MIKHYIHKALTMPPHVTVKKAASGLKRLTSETLLRRKDCKVSSYTATYPKGALSSYFPKLTADHLLPQVEIIAGVTKDYLGHHFDLLSSGWVQVKHGVECPGAEGHRYDMDSAVKIDKAGRWLEGRINPANLPESQRIWQLIFSPHASRLTPHAYLPIDWHVDFKSGYRWPENTWYRDIRYGHKLGADVKVPWELARFQHLAAIALAYQLASNGIDGFKKSEKYASEFRSQVLDFIATNPPRFGVNWACTMDVGIRVANWLVAYDLFQAAGASFDADFEQIFLRSVYDHGLHIINNLEYSDDLTSNHYLADIAGLLFVATYLPRSDETDRWLKFAVQELIKEMEKQVYPDGTDFEASTCYHRLVLELFFYSTLLMVKKHDDFDGGNYKEICECVFGMDYTNRLYKMFDAVCYLLKPTGKMPQIGDNDSGQFLKLYSRDVLDMRYLLALGAIFFEEAKWKIKEFFEMDEDIVEVGILYGEEGLNRWRLFSTNSLNAMGSKSFQGSGWYVMRDGLNYCIISCGPNGQNHIGGHCHNDNLSFELNIDGEDIIIDPGTYLYTPDPKSRNLFRSTAYHNTVVIDRKEQNRFEDWNPFLVKNDAKAKCLKWESDEKQDVFVGEHYGYERLKEPVIHRREILFDKKTRTFRIKDQFNVKGKHLFEWYFHFAPYVEVQLTKDKTMLAKSRSGFKVILSCKASVDGFTVDVFDGWISPAYGRKEKARIGGYSIEKDVHFEVIYELEKINRE